MDGVYSLEQLKTQDILLCDRINLDDIHINKEDSVSVRAEELIKQIKNPYAFKCGEIAVNVEYSLGGKTLHDALVSYLIALKNNH